MEAVRLAGTPRQAAPPKVDGHYQPNAANVATDASARRSTSNARMLLSDHRYFRRATLELA